MKVLSFYCGREVMKGQYTVLFVSPCSNAGVEKTSCGPRHPSDHGAHTDLELATTGHLVTHGLGWSPTQTPAQSSQTSSQWPSLDTDGLRTPGLYLLGWAFLATIKGWLEWCLVPPVYICPWQWARSSGGRNCLGSQLRPRVPVCRAPAPHTAPPLLSCSCPVPVFTLSLTRSLSHGADC